jgi:hypothetical protein
MHTFRRHYRLLTFFLLLLLPLQGVMAVLMPLQGLGQGSASGAIVGAFLPSCHTKATTDSIPDKQTIQNCDTCSLCHLSRHAVSLFHSFLLPQMASHAPVVALTSAFHSHIVCPEHRPPIVILV